MSNNKINKETSCMDDYDQNSITTDQALEKIFDAINPINENEVIPIRESLSRILAENIKANINLHDPFISRTANKLINKCLTSGWVSSSGNYIKQL